MVYQEAFPKGSRVRIADAQTLRRFMRPDWKYHHPVSSEQLAAAGNIGSVIAIGFYHGGDILYELDGIPGTWHEACLSAADCEAK